MGACWYRQGLEGVAHDEGPAHHAPHGGRYSIPRVSSGRHPWRQGRTGLDSRNLLRPCRPNSGGSVMVDVSNVVGACPAAAKRIRQLKDAAFRE
jgi:hypothetical protein